MSWIKSKVNIAAMRAQNILAQGMDLLAPALQTSRIREFQKRWMLVRRYLHAIDNLDPYQRKKLDTLAISDVLLKMVRILATEERIGDRLEFGCKEDSTKPRIDRSCMEYVAQKEIISFICNRAAANEPEGMLGLGMQFMTALLENVSAIHMITDINAHKALVKLIQSASERELENVAVRDGFIRLLTSLWRQLRAHPAHVNLFFRQARILLGEENELESKNALELSALSIYISLLPYMHARGDIGIYCREALVIASGIPQDTLVRFVTQLTPFTQYVVNGITLKYKELLSSAGADGQKVKGSEDLKDFSCYIRFCCLIAMAGGHEAKATDTSIAKALVQDFLSLFLKNFFQEQLLHASEDRARVGTLCAQILLDALASCDRRADSNPLLFAYLHYLLYASTDGESEPSVCSTLFQRVNSVCSALSVATIDLMTSIMEIQGACVDQWLFITVLPDAAPLSEHGAAWFASQFPDSLIATNSDIYHKDRVSQYLNSAHSSSEQHIASVLSYIVDAEYTTTRSKSYSIGQAECISQEPDLSPEFTASSTHIFCKKLGLFLDTKPHNPDCPFLEALFDQIQQFLDNDSDKNLALSGLISAMAQRKNCFHHIFDLADRLPKSVRSVFMDVYTSARQRIQLLDDGNSRLKEMSQAIITNYHSSLSMTPEMRLLCGFVVLQEILKELCSILYVREQYTSMQLQHGAIADNGEWRTCMGDTVLSSDFMEAQGEKKRKEMHDLFQDEDLNDFEILLADAEASMHAILLSDEIAL